MKRLMCILFLGFALLPHSAGAVLSETWRMHPQDLDYFRYDCRVKEQQMVWLASQHPTPWEVFKNDVFGQGLLSYLIQSYRGTYDRHQAVTSRQQAAVVKWLMFKLRNNCDWNTVIPAQCTQTSEQTNSGTAVGKKCWDGRNHQPYINRWEVVD
jgi:hypothetical protein